MTMTMDPTAFIIFLALCVGGLYAVDTYINSSIDPKEPPILKSAVPVFGHAFRYIKYGSAVFDHIRVPKSVKIFTLRIFSIKIYVVSGMDLLYGIQRSSKTLSFRPFERLSVQRFSEGTQSMLDLCDEGGDFEGDGKFVRDVEAVIHKTLSPGPDLDSMNLNTAFELVKLMDDMVANPESKAMDLMYWVRETVGIASATGVYGPKSQYLRKDVRDAFWEFDRGSPAILLGLKRLAPAATTAMHKLMKYTEEYTASGGHHQASALIQGRTAAFLRYGCSMDEAARFEWAIIIAVLANSVPTAFWNLHDIYSRPDLLTEVRDSLLTNAVTTNTDPVTGEKTHTLLISSIKTACPILLASFQETQRLHIRAANFRKVMADTTLEGSILLKKGSFLQVPGQPIHFDESIWGADAATYNPHRFLNRKEKLKPTSLLAWGFAPHMCPGRQFATTEIVMLTALMVLRFDLTPEDDRGWVDLGMDTGTLSGIPPPKKECKVFFKPREEAEGKWLVDVGKSSSKFELVSG